MGYKEGVGGELLSRKGYGPHKLMGLRIEPGAEIGSGGAISLTSGKSKAV